MSFKDNKYYLPLCETYKKLLCGELQLANLNIDHEILARDLMSRLYYTALLHCKEIISSGDPGTFNKEEDCDGTHQRIIKKVKDDIANDLKNLKRHREKADYAQRNEFKLPKNFCLLVAKVSHLLEDQNIAKD